MTLPELSAAAQIELWFFRDINDEARRKLIALCLGQGVADEAKFHNWQRKCLRRILNTRSGQLVERDAVAGVVEAFGAALKNIDFQRGEVVLHASDWMRLTDAIAALRAKGAQS